MRLMVSALFLLSKMEMQLLYQHLFLHLSFFGNILFMKTRIGIVEDEFLIAENISEALFQLGYDPIEPVGSYTEAIKMIDEEKPDILLLDIQLSGKKDGIDLAMKVREDYDIPFIFLTANSDQLTVERAKKASPPAYLVKPFKTEDLYTSIEICLNNYSNSKAKITLPEERGNYLVKDSIFIKQDNYFHKVKVADILYVESDKNYVYVYTTDKKLWVRGSFQGFMELTNTNLFVRVHKSFVVNLEKITLINSDKVFIGTIELPIGKSFREELLNQLKLM